jgi:serine/threonine protein kinase
VCESLKALNEPDNKEHNIVKPKQIIRYESYEKIGYILTEYCSGGDLAHYLKNECLGERMPEGKAKNIMAQVTKGK